MSWQRICLRKKHRPRHRRFDMRHRECVCASNDRTRIADARAGIRLPGHLAEPSYDPPRAVQHGGGGPHPQPTAPRASNGTLTRVGRVGWQRSRVRPERVSALRHGIARQHGGSMEVAGVEA
eukprot:153642-Prymnesium_polylepis.1